MALFNAGDVVTAPAGETTLYNRPDDRCAAYGCLLPGGISESTRGGGPWFCRFHFGAPSGKWADITTAIRNGTIEPAQKGESPAVRDVKEAMAKAKARRERMAASTPLREPGEDDA